MKTIEDILQNISVSVDDNNDEWYLEANVKLAMKEYATEVLKEAANKAHFKIKSGGKEDTFSYLQKDNFIISIEKSSILNIIKELNKLK